MKELNKQFWKETSKLIDTHRKNNDERAAQGVVDSRIIFNRLVKKLSILIVSVPKSTYCECTDNPIRLTMSLIKCAACQKIVED